MIYRPIMFDHYVSNDLKVHVGVSLIFALKIILIKTSFDYGCLMIKCCIATYWKITIIRKEKYQKRTKNITSSPESTSY